MKHLFFILACSTIAAPIVQASTASFGPNQSLALQLKPLITKAQKQCLVATYLLTDSLLVTALINAHGRGVRVEIVTDASMVGTQRGKQVLRQLRAAHLPVFILSHARRRFLMHHKFAVIDNQLWTGSMNWTNAGSKTNHENVIITSNQIIVRQYASHFATLKRRINGIAATTAYRYPVFFIPEHRRQLQHQLNASLKHARSRITLALYDMTSKPLADSLRAAARRQVKIYIIADGKRLKENKHSYLNMLARVSGITVHAFYHQSTLMHHKYAIIDDTVWTGSMNWTRSGMNSNQENVLVLREPAVVASYVRNSEWLQTKCRQILPKKSNLKKGYSANASSIA